MPQNSNHTHALVVIHSCGPEMEETVIRWCPTCGAIVVHIDSDSRTKPGAIMPMRFPEG